MGLTRFRMHRRELLAVRSPVSPRAARLALETDGLVYRKWGAEQRAKSGDWVVDNDGDVYTVDADVFERSYRKVGHSAYVKKTPVWAVQAEKPGSIRTAEGETQCQRGDYIVSHSDNDSDQYAISAENHYR